MNTNYAYLVMVDSANNNNKFYEIKENTDSSIDVNYGRVGGTTMHKHYSSNQRSFYGLIQEKIRKGYEDVTALHSEVDKASPSAAVEKDSYLPIDDAQVQSLMDLLITSSREFMQNNYTVKAANVTQKMIEEASNDINELNRIALNNSPDALFFFNKRLEQLFTDVPRRMGKVEDYLATKESDFDKIIQRETDMLDNLKGIVGIKVQQQTNQDKTVLEAHGLTARPVTYKEEDQITAHLGRDYDGRDVENRYIRAFAVENLETRAAYEDYKTKHNMKPKDVRLFYHGSKVENFYSIMKQGLLLNPNATVTGKMFGQGLYFAPECRKALNYMDVSGAHWNSGRRDSGYCAIYAVALGKCYKPDHILGSGFRGSDLPAGTSSVFASKKDPRLGLRNDEYIVYDQAACTIKYLMEISKENVRTKEYNLNRDILRDGLTIGFDTLIKTPEGFKSELMLESLSSAVRSEICSKITDSYDCDHLYINYNSKQDKITFSIDSSSGDHMDIHPSVPTKDDYAFITRELKKSFAENENEWKNLVKEAERITVGKIVVSKKEITDNNDKSKDKETIKE